MSSEAMPIRTISRPTASKVEALLLAGIVVGFLTGAAWADTSAEAERPAGLAERYIRFSPFSVAWLASRKMAGPSVLSRPTSDDKISFSTEPVAEMPPESNKPGNYYTPGIVYAVKHCSVSGRAVGRLLVSRGETKQQLGLFCDTSNRALTKLAAAINRNEKMFDAAKIDVYHAYREAINYSHDVVRRDAAWKLGDPDAGPKPLLPDIRDFSEALIASGKAIFEARQTKFAQDEKTEKTCSDKIETAFADLPRSLKNSEERAE